MIEDAETFLGVKQRPAAPDSVSSKATENTTFYIKVNDAEKGPYTLGQLRSMWASGQITADALYRTSDSSEWLALAERLSGSDVISNAPIAAVESAPASSRKGPLWVFIFVLLAATAYGVYYGYNHLGGNDVVVGYSSSSPEGAERDAISTLNHKYSSYDTVEAFGDDSGTSVQVDVDYSGEKRSWKKGTWKYTIRVKNAQPKRD